MKRALRIEGRLVVLLLLFCARVSAQELEKGESDIHIINIGLSIGASQHDVERFNTQLAAANYPAVSSTSYLEPTIDVVMQAKSFYLHFGLPWQLPAQLGEMSNSTIRGDSSSQYSRIQYLTYLRCGGGLSKRLTKSNFYFGLGGECTVGSVDLRLAQVVDGAFNDANHRMSSRSDISLGLSLYATWYFSDPESEIARSKYVTFLSLRIGTNVVSIDRDKVWDASESLLSPVYDLLPEDGARKGLFIAFVAGVAL